MSRIDDALKRISGKLSEPRAPSMLERYALEKGRRPEPLPDDSTVSNSAAAGSPASAAGEAVVADRHTSPASPPSVPSSPEAQSADNESLIDFRQIANYAQFVFGALGRHKVLASATFITALAMTAAAIILLPKTYHAQTKLLAQRNEVMTALSNPGRAVPWDADAPTHAAAETVLRRDNLITLVRQTDLLNDWERTRAPILRLKDFLTRTVLRRRPGPDEKLEQLVGLLEARIIVTTGPTTEGTVQIDLDWPNAQTAFRLVEAAQQDFLEARQLAERSAIGESIAILERYSATLHEEINRTLAELQKTKAKGPAAVGAGTTVRLSPARVPVVPPQVAALLPPPAEPTAGAQGADALMEDPEIAPLRAALAAKRQEIVSLEEGRQRQLADLRARLAQMSTVYTQTHPSVVTVQESIAALSRDSPQVIALRAETDRIAAEYERRTTAAAVRQEERIKAEFENRAAAAAAAPPRVNSARPGREVQPREVTTTPPAGEPADFSSLQLRLELNQLSSVLERTDGARIELAVSQAAFKYRYTVIRPAQVPRSPIRPNIGMVAVAGVFGGVALAFAAALGKDLLGNRILELWQIERQLGLPVLGTLRNA
jgi:uncharacterized protein involved in exopolysaccharide biosynthesis